MWACAVTHSFKHICWLPLVHHIPSVLGMSRNVPEDPPDASSSEYDSDDSDSHSSSGGDAHQEQQGWYGCPVKITWTLAHFYVVCCEFFSIT